jgi:hypothetical protein
MCKTSYARNEQDYETDLITDEAINGVKIHFIFMQYIPGKPTKCTYIFLKLRYLGIKLRWLHHALAF